MVQTSRQLAADRTKSRFASLLLVLSTLFLIAAATLFNPNTGVLQNADIAGQRDTVGWILNLFSMFCSASGLAIALTMSTDDDDDEDDDDE